MPKCRAIAAAVIQVTGGTAIAGYGDASKTLQVFRCSNEPLPPSR
jgi:hypothetical protein